MKQNLFNKLWLRVGMIVAIMTTALAGTVWAEDVTMAYSGSTTTNMTGGNDAATVGLSATNWSVVGAKGGGSNYPGLNKDGTIRLYASSGNGSTITVTSLASNTTITSITLNVKSGTATVLVGSSEVTATNNVYNINSTSFVIANQQSSGQVQINSITITYSSASSYTITAQSNNNSYGTVSLSGSVITAAPATGYTYADPAYSVSPENSATVSQNGNEFTVTPSANTTVTINFTAIPTYTVTFSDGGSETEATGGAGVTLPSRSDIGSYTFAGWSTTNVPTETTTAPTTIIPAGTYHPTGNITLYPVYTKTEGGGTVNNTASITISDYATDNSWINSTQYLNVSLDANVTASAAGGGNTGKYYTSGNEWRFYQNESPTLTISTSNGTLTSITITYNISNTGILEFNNSNITSGTTVNVSGTSAEFTVGNTGSATNGQVKITAIEVNYSTSGGTTYYWSSPVAATVEHPVITVAENPFYFSTTATITCETAGATIYYTLDGNDPTTSSDVYSTAIPLTATTTIKAFAVLGSDESSIASVTATKNLATPTVTVSGDLEVDLDGGTDVDAGTLTAAVTYNDAPVAGATVTWSSNAPAVATIDASGAVTLLTTGTVTFTATYAGDNSDYAGATGTKMITVIDTNAPGTTAANPYTVAQAVTAIQALPNNNATTESYYISGKVSAFYENATGIMSASNKRYYISDDGTTTGQLLVYNGKALGNVAFSSDDDLLIGDRVIVYGKIQNYQGNTPEIASNNYIYSLQRTKVDPTISVSDDDVDYGDTYVVPTVGITGGPISVTSSNTNVATVDGLIITPVAVGTTTITVATAENASYNEGSATFELTVNRPVGGTEAPTGSAGAVLFNETFDNFTGTGYTGGHDGVYTGSVGTGSTTTNKPDEEDWEDMSNYGADQCLKLGTGSAYKAVTTRSIALTGNGTLTFSAAGWGDSNANQLNVTASGATLSGDIDITLTNGAWDDYTVNITNGNGNVQITFSMKRGFLDDVKVESEGSPAPAITYTIPSSGLGTYCSEYPIDLDELPTGVKAYAVTAKGESSVTLTEITGTIKGGVGFVVEGVGGTEFDFTFAGSSTVPTNLLVGTLAPEYLAANTVYGLKSGTFQPNNAGTINAHRAYLPASPGGAVKALTLIFEDDATGITHTRVITDDATIYDLTGRRLNKMQKGINIVNGKKILK